ncbi:MAG: hypothetical protein ABI688_07575 [Bacteroidota bacterium]
MASLFIQAKRGIGFGSALFLLLFLTGCSHPGTSPKRKLQEPGVPVNAPATYKKPPAGTNDTLIISGNSAVFYNPDSMQREKIKEISSRENFETTDHNCVYLALNARMVLKRSWPRIRIVETSANRYLLFVKDDKTGTCIDLNSKGDMCGLFLFDGKKVPELVDMMNIDTALGFYFEK